MTPIATTGPFEQWADTPSEGPCETSLHRRPLTSSSIRTACVKATTLERALGSGPSPTSCRGLIVGRDCNICDGAFIEGGAAVGDRVTIKNQVLIFEGVTIEDDVFLGPGVVFTNDLRPRAHIKRHGAALLPTTSGAARASARVSSWSAGSLLARTPLSSGRRRAS